MLEDFVVSLTAVVVVGLSVVVGVWPSRSRLLVVVLLPLLLLLLLLLPLLLLLLLLAFRLEREVHAREEGVADLLEDVRLGLGVRHLVRVITR